MHFHAMIINTKCIIAFYKQLEVLERIDAKFKDFGSVDISNYSHKEKGYCATKKGEIISYAYAKDIQLDCQ